MKKFLSIAFASACLAALILLCTAETTHARSKYKKAFYKQYVDGNEPYKSVADNKATGRCWLCHVNMDKFDPPEKGMKKRIRNSYGVAMSQFLKENEKDMGKIAEALKKVADIRSDATNDSSPTFGELIANGKLPGDGKPNTADLEAARQRKAEEDAKKAAK